MHLKAIFLGALSAINISFCAIAAPITYQIEDDYSSILTGTITTDGTIGALTAGNITSFSLAVYTGSGWLNLNESVGFLNSVSGLSATEPALTMDFSGTTNSMLFYFGGFESLCIGGEAACDILEEGTDSSGFFVSYNDDINPFTYLNTLNETGVKQLASNTIAPVPIPAALPMLASAFVIIGLYRRKSHSSKS